MFSSLLTLDDMSVSTTLFKVVRIYVVIDEYGEGSSRNEPSLSIGSLFVLIGRCERASVMRLFSQPGTVPSHFGPQHCVRTRQAPRPFCPKPPAEGFS